MSTTITQYGDVTVLAAKDDLAGDEVDSFVSKAAFCFDEGRRHIVIDCAAVGTFDSAALEALIDLHTKCESDLGAVKLCGLDANCSKILEMTRLSRRFEEFDTLESAVKSFA